MVDKLVLGEAVTCALLSSLIDVDHFLEARSFNIRVSFCRSKKTNQGNLIPLYLPGRDFSQIKTIPALLNSIVRCLKSVTDNRIDVPTVVASHP